MNSKQAQIVSDDIYEDFKTNIQEGVDSTWAFHYAIIRFIHLYLKLWINRNV